MPAEGSAATPELPELMKSLLRACLAKAVTGHPALGLGGPVALVRVSEDDVGPVLTAATTQGAIGLRRVSVRPMPRSLDWPTLQMITDIGEGTALAVIGTEKTQAGDLYALRSLVRVAQTTATAAEFAAVTLQSSAGFGRSAPGTLPAGARSLLAALHAGAPTNERRQGVYARLRRLVVPRQGELADELRVPSGGTENELRAESLYEQALRRWPEPFLHAVADGEPPESQGGRVVAVPGAGHPAEERTRIRELDSIGSALADVTRPALFAILAEAGMGKSALAARACRHLSSRYEVTGWLTATDAASWRASTILLAGQLGLDDPSPEALWAELTRRSPALIVVDDAPEPREFRHALPEVPGVHVLLTSQSVRWGATTRVLELEPLDLAESAEYLLARTGAHDEELAAAVAERIHGYPIALEQAAAAIVEGVSLHGWLARQRSDAAFGASALRDVWAVRISSLRERHPDAFSILRALACAGPGPVPGSLLEILSADIPGRPTLPFGADVGRRDTAVAELRSQGLIRTGVDVETMSLHPLLAGVLREDDGFDVADMAMRVAAATSRLIDDYDRDDIATWPVAASVASAAISACKLVLTATDGREHSLESWMPGTLADRTLWPVAGYLHETGASREAYRARLLGLALRGDEVAKSVVREWTGKPSTDFSDLSPSDVVPAASLGAAADAKTRLLAARWINEQVMLLADVDVSFGLEYAQRALELAPPRLPSAGEVDAVPWAAQIRIEIFDNLGYMQLLAGEHGAAYATFNRAIRLRRKYPSPEQDEKYAQLLNDRALADMDSGRPAACLTGFTRAREIAYELLGPEAAMLDNIENNLAVVEHWRWHLRSAGERLRKGLDRLWDRLNPQDTAVIIQQCNVGRVAYDLGSVTEGFGLVEGAWQVLADRLGPDDRETLIRLLALSRLRFFRGDLDASLEGLTRELAGTLATSGENAPEIPAYRLLCAWLPGVAALTESNARSLYEAAMRASGGSGMRAAMALDFRTAHALAGASAEVTVAMVRDAERAIAVNRSVFGPWHPATLLAHGRAALLACDLSGAPGALAATAARRLLFGADSMTEPGPAGFARDLARAGQPPLDHSRPGWEADRIVHLLRDGLIDLDVGEELAWRANAGRLAALAGRADEALLPDAAARTSVLYGPFHPWTLLRRASAAVAGNDPEELRLALSLPFWI